MTARIISFLSVLLLCSVMPSEKAFAKMAYKRLTPFETSHIIKMINSKTTIDKNLLELVVIADEVFSIKTIYSDVSDPTQVSSQNILHQIKLELRAKSNWNERISSSALKKLEAKQAYLHNILGEKSFEWAWVLNQLGEKQNSKDVLKKLFESQYKSVMELKITFFDLDGGPLSEIETTFKALKTLSTVGENTENQEKMKRAKIHISQLPQSHIMT